jgi:hypothetical protein
MRITIPELGMGGHRTANFLNFCFYLLEGLLYV